MDVKDKVCSDCGKIIDSEKDGQYFSQTKRYWHTVCYQSWSQRMLERGVQMMTASMERRKAL